MMEKTKNLLGVLNTLLSINLPDFKDRQEDVIKALFFGLQPYLNLNGMSYEEAEANFLTLVGICRTENPKPIYWAGSIRELQYFLNLGLKGKTPWMDNLNHAFRYQNRKGDWVTPKLSANRDANLKKMCDEKKFAEKFGIEEIFNNALNITGLKMIGTEKYNGTFKIVEI